MKLNILVYACALFGLMSPTLFAGIVTFDLEEGTGFDTAGAGATMTATNGVDTVVATTVDVRAPQYSATSPFPPTGLMLSALGGDAVQTNIVASNSSLGVNNPSISNTNFGIAGGPTGASGESANFNLNESWIVEFDQPVRAVLFNFSSLDLGEQFEVSVEGIPGLFTFVDDGLGDDFVNPLGMLIIPAGNNITFTSKGDSIAAVSTRISEIQVELIPEPSVLAMAFIAMASLWPCRAGKWSL